MAHAFFGKTASTTAGQVVYGDGLANFIQTYLVYGLCMCGMITGLFLGKRFLSPETFLGGKSRSNEPISDPRTVYFLSSLLVFGCIFGASYLANAEFSSRFWIYVILMGFFNGLFSGIAYQAPMLACQLYFPDRKQLVAGLLLFGLAAGLATYSGLTTYWATKNGGVDGDIDLSLALRNLSYCMVGHILVASILLSTPRS